MMTNAASTCSLVRREAHDVTATTATRKVVVVGGSAEILDLLDTVLNAGHYDVVFVESHEHAYSHIKRVQPNLVILCVRIEDVNGCQVLSMLSLDQDTCHIPVLTYTTEHEGQESEEELAKPSGAAMFAAKPAVVKMN